MKAKTIKELCEEFGLENIEFSKDYSEEEREQILKSLYTSLKNIAFIFRVEHIKVGHPRPKKKLSIVFCNAKQAERVANGKCLALFDMGSDTIFVTKGKYFAFAHEYGHFIYDCLTNKEYKKYIDIVGINSRKREYSELEKSVKKSLKPFIKRTYINYYNVTGGARKKLLATINKLVKMYAWGCTDNHTTAEAQSAACRRLYSNEMIRKIKGKWNTITGRKMPKYMKEAFTNYFDKIMDLMTTKNCLTSTFNYTLIKDMEDGWDCGEVYYSDDNELFARMFDYVVYRCMKRKCWMTDGKPLKKYGITGLNEKVFQPFLMDFWGKC